MANFSPHFLVYTMIALTYVSSATKRFTDEELSSLLKTCHHFNTISNISGLLLYNHSGTFLQILEGDAENVEAIYEKITADTRHQRVHRISRKDITEREFPDWKMGFRNLSNTPLNHINGFSDFMESEKPADYLLKEASFAKEILTHFKNTSNEVVL